MFTRLVSKRQDTVFGKFYRLGQNKYKTFFGYVLPSP